jgi:catechol 2,3-dioxygenase-like lactoylglutathione lyase family enzyme
MSAVFQFDHAVIRVNDLAAATNDYSALGFTVTPGGEHPGRGSHNALIAFADGTYLELIAFPGKPTAPGQGLPREARSRALRAAGRSPVDARALPWETAEEGLVDFALLPQPIEAALAAARARGLDVDGPFPGGRVRPDGQQVAWQLGVPDGYDLPFLCADVTPRSLRVPGGAVCRHANGAAGLAEVAIAVADVERGVDRYRALLGIGPQENPTPPVMGVRKVSFVVGPTTLLLSGPSALGDPGPRSLRLWTTNEAGAGVLDAGLTHGAKILLWV